MRSRFLKDLKVLLVEDEPKLAMLLTNAISDTFHTFVVASDGEEGLSKFFDINPDIVITDIMMPRLTGLDMAKRIRESDSEVPIIILSAFSETENFLNAIDVGVVKYFIKPFDPDELFDYITSVAEKLGSRVVELEESFSFNTATNKLYKKGRYVSLTKQESQFFNLLMKDPEYTVDARSIKTLLWRDEVSDERLRTFIRRVREKTSKNLIENIKGEGYHIVLRKSNDD